MTAEEEIISDIVIGPDGKVEVTKAKFVTEYQDGLVLDRKRVEEKVEQVFLGIENPYPYSPAGDGLCSDIAGIPKPSALEDTAEHVPLPPSCGDGFLVYWWPEFQALMARMGIPKETYTKGLTIRVYEGEAVTCVHEFIVQDRGPTPPVHKK